MKIVREVILRCTNCHCAVKVEITKLDFLDKQNLFYTEDDLLFTVLKNAE